jgi:acyl-CoA-binding protein|tara:strand:+ start:469 stop:741 length:273 start_codon:yes stop_codon:yes gene_type:complete
MEEIEKRFLEAVEEVSNSTWGDKVPDKRKLLIYAYYKQSTIGDINTEQPWAYQVKARAKWDAWNSVKNYTIDVAMRMYVAEFEKQKQEFA